MSEFWIGLPERPDLHWDGRPRRCAVLGEVVLASGQPGLHVRLEPPLRADPSLDELHVAVIAPRYQGIEVRDAFAEVTPVRVCRIERTLDGRDRFEDGDLLIETNVEAAPTKEAVPDVPNVEAAWQEALAEIRRFIVANGHSRVPRGTRMARGMLDIVVFNLRWYHAPWDPGTTRPNPYPGVAWESQLDSLDGWTWELDEPRE